MSERRYKKAKLTETLLEQLNACESGIEFVSKNKLQGMPLVLLKDVKGDYNVYFYWIRRYKYIFTDKNNNLRRYVLKDGEELNCTYDDNGNKLYERIDDSEVWQEFDNNNNITMFRSSYGSSICYKYDNKGRKILTHDLTNELRSFFVYPGSDILEKAHTIGLNNNIIEYFNTNNKVTKINRYGKDLWIYEYDDRGNLLKVSNLETGLELNYGYDNHNRLVEYSGSYGTSYINEYDDNGNITLTKYNNGDFIKCEYDENNNNILYESSVENIIIDKDYDCNNNLIHQNIRGINETFYRFDENSNLIYKKIGNHVELDISSEYYSNGQLKRIGTLTIPKF